MGFFSSENTKQYHSHSEIDVSSRRRRKTIPGTSSSSGPVLSSSSKRRKVSSVNDIELTDTGSRRGSSLRGFGYSEARKSFDFKKHLRRLPLYIFAIFLMRLFFMDRGVIEYFDSQDNLALMEFQLKESRDEIKVINDELKLIRNSKAYQKKLARDHLGVIGPDEYLVLFAQESKAPSI